MAQSKKHKQQNPQPLPEEKTPRPFPALLLLSAVTLALCGAAFGLFEIRRNRELSAENEALKERRIELITHIKTENREISALRDEIDSMNNDGAAPASKPIPKKRPIGSFESGDAGGAGGIPESFDNGTPDKKLVALTFDGGANNSGVGDILDTLKSRNVKATMFLTGAFLKAYPSAVRRIAAEGHEVGNHTLSHPHLTSWAQDHTQTTLDNVSEAFLCNQLATADSIFSSITGGHFAHLWRAPYGEKNRTVCAWARRCGYIHIGWRQGKTWRQGLDSNDWVPDEETPGYHTPQEVVDKVIALAGEGQNGINGGIILMHLGSERKDAQAQMYRMLGKLIDDLKGLGYSLVTVSEMLKSSGVDVSALSRN
jgi:peptidoglycan/xylan/chitin deacetylase (PgdA/CDA1 family)